MSNFELKKPRVTIDDGQIPFISGNFEWDKYRYVSWLYRLRNDYENNHIIGTFK